jgi:hypothetical protein
MKALTEAGSLGGSKLNLKGTGWETDGTARSMDGDEVASGTDLKVPFDPGIGSGCRLEGG